jgi:DNA polymerase-3 subunit gamma/tau
MPDSTDMFGDPQPHEAQPSEVAPSAAELEAAGQSALFGDPVLAPAPAPAPPKPVATPAAPPPAPTTPYRVLARKYRPQTFSQLIGQEAMVQTLANAIRRERLAHAFLMTGVRGVGKTSTARLIAKALNCIGPDGQGGATIDPCGVCEPCVAIAEGRHIDVIEMDAASHTGVDDVREIIEAVRYAAVSARYKIYIIDEVHMLSRNAFNALLKTLEEPPAHVKFLFATTEADKLPVTVLSRCQRFDLRRIPTPMLADHFAWVCSEEHVEAEPEALAMIASAAEGSVRDGLSILDQAISHADFAGSDEDAGKVSAAQVRDMLGLADKAMQRRLFTALLSGDGTALIEDVAAQYSLGVEPVNLMRAQLDLVHRITVSQFGSGADGRSAEERAELAAWGKQLSAGQLHRLWQLLLKGYEEVRTSPDPLASAQMALLRVAHAAELPDPGQLAKRLEELAARGPAPAPAQADGSPGSAPAAYAPSEPRMDWAALVDSVDRAGLLVAAGTMRDWVRVVELGHDVLRFQLAPGYSADVVPEIKDALLKVTGQRWQVERVPADPAMPPQPSLRELAESEATAAAAALRADPLVKAAFTHFPEAELIDEAKARDSGAQSWSKRA